MKLLICGGRDFNDKEVIEAIFDTYEPTELINGGAGGADAQALSTAQERNIPVQLFMAKWAEYGNSAGPIRNKRMLNVGKPDLVVAVCGGRGTMDMLYQAEKANVKTFIFGSEAMQVQYDAYKKDRDSFNVRAGKALCFKDDEL